jgi:16S rRNA (cytosine967-C5)-methyltransferase
VAAGILQRVEEGGFSTLLVRSAVQKLERREDRSLLRDLVGGTLRWRGRLDFLLTRYSRRPLDKLDPLLLQNLRVGLYQLVFLPRIPGWAVVNETVDSVSRGCGRSVVGYANGVLRAAARDRERYPEPELDPANPARHIASCWSLPEWLANRWVERFGAEETARLAEASAARPRVAFRLTRVPGREPVDETALLTELADNGVEAGPHPLVPGAWVLTAGSLERSPALAQGRLVIQDPASQLVPLLTGLEPGNRALDGCAAPGAKTVRLAELVGPSGRVVAADLHPNRLALVADNARRTGCGWIEPVACDLSNTPLQGRPFDAVLVDAPCTGTGTLRRHPEIRWRLEPDAPVALAETQLRILRGAARLVVPGGCLVYSVCSLEPEEGPGLVERFLPGSGFRLDDARPFLPTPLHRLVRPDGTLLSLPHRDDCDGFFAARLIREN